MNKLFLSQVVLAVNRLFPDLEKQKQETIKRINITNEEAEVPYKIEDIHASRQTNFEREVEKKRMEFETYMTHQKPKDIDLSYGKLDDKITEMDELVAKKMEQRKIDISQLYVNDNNIDFSANNWLNPNKPLLHNKFPKQIENDDNNISLRIENKKTVSWKEDGPERTTDIFQKLKRNINLNPNPNLNINLNPNPNLNINLNPNSKSNVNNHNFKYEEQISQPLPEIKQEQISRSEPSSSSSGIVPIVPKSEIVRHLNDMNEKIENLYKMVYKLTNSMDKLVQHMNLCNETITNNVDANNVDASFDELDGETITNDFGVVTNGDELTN
jgi:hypothetical protein